MVTGQPQNLKRKDEISELTHERDKWRLLNEIESLKNPPPPPPEPPKPKPPKSKAQKEKDDQNRREKEAPRREAEAKEWRKELYEDPHFPNEDIDTEIERRKRARGWLDDI